MLITCISAQSNIYGRLIALNVRLFGGVWISAPTVRKLRRVGDGANDTGYYLLPPKNWVDQIEKKAGKKILYFALKTEMYELILNPVFEKPQIEPPRNSSPELINLMLKQGSLLSKLREIHKGKNIYRVINIPRTWVRSKEQARNRKVIALQVTAQPTQIIVEPLFAGKQKNDNRAQDE